jgi:nucleotidyltransferase/DNA polymerase involved in DNA repair
VRVAGEGAGWREVEAPLRRGVRLALAAAAALQREVGLTASCGVAGGKLLARLVGPLNKPACTTCGSLQLQQPAAHALPLL